MTVENKKELLPERRKELLNTLKARFEKNINRHKGLEWAKVQAKLDPEHSGEKLWSLNEMERTGGEPDVVDYDKKTIATAGQAGEYIFYDCSAESPKAAEVFVTTAKRWSRGKNINRKIILLIWLQIWVFNF